MMIICELIHLGHARRRSMSLYRGPSLRGKRRGRHEVLKGIRVPGRNASWADMLPALPNHTWMHPTRSRSGGVELAQPSFAKRAEDLCLMYDDSGNSSIGRTFVM